MKPWTWAGVSSSVAAVDTLPPPPVSETSGSTSAPAMGPADGSVLVNEWAGYRITRLWLTGPKRGKRETFIDNLPGYPDNIHRDATGLYWVGPTAIRIPM